MPSHTELIDEYLATPKLLRDSVAAMTRAQLIARPIPGKWSTLEVVVHIADFEPVYADRMKRVIALEMPLLIGADQDRYLKRLAYHDRDLEEELSLIELTRKSLARVLKTLPAEAFQRVGCHSERGLTSLEQFLNWVNGHIHHHLPFIAEKRKALGIK